MKTIKQLADEIGVSKQAINKKIDNLGCRNQLTKNGNQWLIPESTENTIKNAFASSNKKANVDSNNSQTLDTLIAVLTDQLAQKDTQICVLKYYF